MNIIEVKLFRVRNTTYSRPIFYIKAIDIIQATSKASEIVQATNKDAVIRSVERVEQLFLEIEDGAEQ